MAYLINEIVRIILYQINKNNILYMCATFEAEWKYVYHNKLTVQIALYLKMETALYQEVEGFITR